MALGASLSESLASLAASSHDAACSNFVERMMAVGVWSGNLWGETRAKKEEALEESSLPFVNVSLLFSLGSATTEIESANEQRAPGKSGGRRGKGRTKQLENY